MAGNSRDRQKYTWGTTLRVYPSFPGNRFQAGILGLVVPHFSMAPPAAGAAPDASAISAKGGLRAAPGSMRISVLRHFDHDHSRQGEDAAMWRASSPFPTRILLGRLASAP